LWTWNAPIDERRLIQNVASRLHATSSKVRVDQLQRSIRARREETRHGRECIANSNSPLSRSAPDIDTHYFNFWSTWEGNILGGDEKHFSSEFLEPVRRFPTPAGHSILVVKKGNNKRIR
jgi:hypothetical protein